MVTDDIGCKGWSTEIRVQGIFYFMFSIKTVELGIGTPCSFHRSDEGNEFWKHEARQQNIASDLQ